MSAMQTKLKGSNAAYDAQIALVRCVLQNRLPLAVCSSWATSSFVAGLIGNSYAPLEESRRDALLDISFARMISKITTSIADVKSYYKKGMDEGDQVGPFLSIVHSKWAPQDDTNLYGVHLTWIDPADFQLNTVALGIVNGCPESASVADAMKTAGELTKKFGVNEEDILMSLVNNPSYYAESYDVQNKKMNILQLIFTEAMKPAEQVIDKAREMIFFISESPERWNDYLARSAETGRTAARLVSDSEDSVVGIYSMINLLVRSYYCIQDFFNQEPRSNQRFNLTSTQWQTLAQVEALMRPVVQLDMDIPSNRPTASMSWLHFKRALHMCTKDTFRVVSFERTDWGADISMDLIPAVKMTVDRNATSVPQVNQICLQIYQTFKAELKLNATNPTDLQLIAMLCDPLVMTTGKLVVQSDSKIWETAQRIFTTTVGNEADSLSAATLQAIKEGEKSQEEPEVGLTHDEDDYMSQLRTAEAGREVVSTEAAGDSAADEIARWLSLKNIDWEEEYFSQNAQMSNKACRGQLFDRTKIENAYYLYSKVDPLIWWQKKKKEFPIIYRVAAKYLSIPVDSFGNHFQVTPFLDVYKPKHLGTRKFEQIVVQSFNSRWLASVEDTSDSALRNRISRGKPKNVEEYVKILYKFHGEKIEEGDQSLSFFDKDVEKYAKDLMSKVDPATVEAVKTQKPKRKKQKVKSIKIDITL